MKRIVFSVILLVISLSGMGQNIGDAFYIYRNDGQFNAFFRDEVDSIAYSYYDSDSVYYDEIVTQLVYTADSLYRIPLAAIDSVGFVQPEAIVNDDVFPLTAEHSPYISDADTLKFTMSNATPENLRPKVGNIVVATADCDVFPDGIMARVLSKTQDDKGIHYNCEKVGLDEVYDQLIFMGEGLIDEAMPQTAVKRKIEVTAEHKLWDKTWSETLQGGGTTTTLTVGDAARITITVNKQLGKPMYFRLDLQNDLKASLTFNAKNSFEKYFEKQIAKVTFPRIRIPQCPLLFIVPKLTLSGYFAEGAEVNLDLQAHYKRMDRVSFVLQNNRWSTYYTPKNDADVDVASLSMTGHSEIGLIPDLLFSFCGSATGLGIEGRVGIKESVDFKFDAVAAYDEDMYSALKDSYASTTIPWSMRAYVQLGVFGDGIQPVSVKLSGEPKWGTDKYLLPLFTEPEYQKGANEQTAVLKTEPSRDLLLPVQLGMSFYEGDNMLETKYLSTNYRNQSQWPLDGVQAAYTNMEEGKIYTAYPIVKIMGKELRALPSKDFPELHLCPDENHPHWIDLGLPSGTQWRCCNEGASAPEEYGGYYTFGQVSSAPTIEQIEEFLDHCSYIWTTLNGVKGGKFTGPNGASVFFPAAGAHRFGEFYDVGYNGYYWSSTSYGTHFAYGLGFGSSGAYWGDDPDQMNSHSIRPVR